MLSVIKRFLAWMRQDGKLHFAFSALIAFSLWPFLGPKWAATGVVVIGLGKEIKDQITGRGTPELHDILCDLLGLAYFFIVVCLTCWLT